ncbi:MAG: DUF1192 family protein [Hyphomicrobiales bacterium]|nr:DUF1192 family protein [Hyphomicrobiales bacterium]MDE2115701.1 DUF1192 domain-containing protein [Hyphomicrobiales bacterium]
MAKDDEDAIFGAKPKKAPAQHEIGADLSAVSVSELQERITLLEREVERCRENMRQKQASAAAADAFFRPKP